MMLLYEAFESQVTRQPYAIALTDGAQNLTYAELNAQANRLAHRLLKAGAGADVCVGLYLEAGALQIISMLAVMKAGAAYVPLDPSLPKQRISQIAGQCGLSVVIQSAAHQQTLPIEVAHLINADDVEAYGPSDNPDQRVEPEHLCYVMFTSGSTGTPKGVMVTHGNLEPLYQDIGPHLDISADDVWSLFHPFSFGFSIWEIWGALSHGGRLVIISPELRTDPSAFFELIKVEAVTIVSQTPSAFRQNMLDSAFDQDLSATALRLIVLSGEAVDSQAVATWIERHGDTEPRLVNTYAITETAGQVTCASLSRELISKDQSKNVGLPLKHVEVLLLDDEGQPVQRGNPGELCVGGPSVAVGYIGELELTAQQFINRSFAGCESTRWYKTGDRARLTVKGEIEFLGRRDDQIKLRGYRIELGEIETALRAHPQVRDAAVALKATSAGSQRLVGYAVPNAAEDHSSRPQFWPSVGPYQVYDEFLYDLMSAEAERLERYRQAFAGTVAGKVVLDIGTGEHALLARMCVDEGARRVYAVEVLEEAFVKAKAFVKAQGLEQQIIVLQGDIANIDLPERADVCTQGIIGNIGSADGIVPIWNSARHHFQPDCIPVPARCRTMIAAVELPQSLLQQPAFSSLASGYAGQVFEKMGRHFDIRLCVSDFPEEAVISAPHEFEDLNFTTHLAEQSAGSATFKIDRDARLDGYLVWTVVTTAGDEDVDYRRNQRAWLPVFFPLGETGDAWGEAVESGQEIQVSWSSQMTTGIQPDYEVRTSINGHDYAYRSCYDEQALNGTPVHRALWGSLPAAATSLSPEALKEWLAARLPEYMVPSAWLMLDQLPMNANQKLDRAALPSPDDDAGSAPGTADLPNTPLEKDLLALWSEILGNDHMGVHDNFFDLGGDSIAAVRMTSALQRLLDDAVMLIAIFEAPSIASLAEFLQVHHRDAVTARYEESEQSTVVATQETSDGRADAPLSWQQQSFWVLSQLYPSMTGANEQFVITLDGALDIQRLEAAWNELLSRHDILHTVFLDHDDGVRQIVRPHESVALEVHDWTELDSEVSRDRLFMAAAEQAIVQDYDLANGPLLKADVFQLNARRSKLLVNAHHIIADGLSIRVIRDELAALYAQPNALPLPRMQYCDYALRQLADAHDGRWDRGIAYWRKTLAGAPDNVALPYRLSTLDTTDRFGYQRRAGFVIDATLAADVRALSRASGATLFMTLMAAFRVLLQRYSAQDDVLIGSPVTGREMGSTSEMIGCLVNNVAFRNSLSANESFADILIRERDAVLNGLPHAQVPFERVVEAIQPHRQFGQHPLFQVLFLFEDAYQRSLSGGGIDFGLQTLNTSRNSYWDLECSVSDVGEGGPIKGYIGYAAELFDADFAEAISGHFIHLLRGIVNDPQQPVGRIGLTDPVRSRQWQEVRHANERHWPGPQTLHARFVEQAALTPDVVALYTDDGSLTYDQLARRSEWLASQLNRQGIGAGDLVGIGAGRSVELIVAIVATLRAGAAYVPLDPGYPALRLQHMVANSGVRMILADAKLPRSVNGTLETIRLDQVDWSAAKDTEADSQELRVDVTGGDRAYVLYTSGSTGLPKGAVGLHRGAVNRCEWMWEAYGFTHQDIFCLRTSPNFVDSVWEIFGPLTHGAALRIIKDDDVADPESLLKHLAAPVVSDGGSISHVVVVPSLLEALLDHDDRLGQQLPRLKTWITSGEPLSPELLQRFRTACPDTLLLNTYGTSEIWDATCFDTNDWETGDARVPIGFPIANVRTYVLDEYLEPVTPGVTGELYVAGAGLGSGYWQQPELTAEKFVADPFVDVEGARMYRTGDLARIRSDGCIECLGRVDRQIKLRGFRVEPDEIAAVLREHCTVNRAFVALAKQKNLAEEADVAPVMVAYWEPADSMPPDQVNKNDQQLRAFLKTRLPAYMVPAVLMAVDPLPLTPNGKVDAQALSALELPEHSSVVAALPLVLPEGETENAVASIWCDVLGIEQCSVQADFFDSGGHSLSATRFLARLRSHFDIDFGLAQFFDAPTIAEVAGHVDVLCEQQHTASVHVIATPGQQSRPDRIPLSFGQERLWFLNELDAGSPAYNIAFTIRFTDRPDLIVLQAAVQHIVQRHEMLRTRFDSVGGKPVQVVMPELSLPVRQASLGDQSAASWQKHLAELAAQPFDLEQGPLLHLHLLSGAGAEHALLVVIHHMISDGLSNAVLFEELAIVYEALADGREPSLPPLPAQYADFALWQRSDTQLREHEKQLDYWRRQLADAPPALELPTDYLRPAEQMFRGEWVWREISAEQADALRALGRRHGCTLYMVMLAVFKVLLHRYSGQSDIVVGSPVGGRHRAEFDRLIGLFINTVAIRTKLDGEARFTDLLADVRETTLASQVNQDVPFERLVEALQPDRTLSHAPVFQVMFNLTPVPDQTAFASGFEMRMGRLLDHGVSNFDLTLSVGERIEGLDLIFEFDKDLFDRATIRRMAGQYNELLSAVLEEAKTPVGALPLWSESEQTLFLSKLHRHTSDYKPQTVLQRFESMVDQQPDAAAVVAGDVSLTYAELDARANQLSYQLRDFGVVTGEVVAICLDRSAGLIIAILAALKSGCAYVALDPDQPPQRLAGMLDTVEPAALMTRIALAKQLSFAELKTLLLDEDHAAIARQSGQRPRINNDPASAAYIVFTSGSTGLPKAVSVTHHNLDRVCEAWREAYGLSPGDRHLQMAGCAFDVFTGDWVRALCTGGSLVICPKSALLEPERLYGMLHEQRITCGEFVPAVVRSLLGYLEKTEQELSFMRLLIVGSDIWHGSEYSALKNYCGADVRVINSYGTAETTIDSSWYEAAEVELDSLTSSVALPIGQPFPGTQLYVCDTQLNLLPVGVPGELCIGGEGVAQGYVGNAALTAERFVEDPFKAGGRLYRTGDRARYRHDGSLELLGRLDRQIKLRGFRIELGEIEAVLSQQPGISAAAVTVQDAHNDQRLVAYVAPSSSASSHLSLGPPDTEALRAALRQLLPDYMVPSLIMTLDALPLTPNGKVDRNRLPVPDWHQAVSAHHVPPRGAVESALAGLYGELLGVRGVGAHDSFFDLGGHSLLATQLVSRIRDALDVELPLRALFDDPTVAGLAKVIQEQSGALLPTVQPRLNDLQAVPLSLTQQRLWFVDRLNAAGAAYNLHWAVRIRGSLDKTALAGAVNAVIARHEILRTTFSERGGIPLQHINDHLTLLVDEVACEPRLDIDEYLSTKVNQPFDLSAGPLLRVHVLEQGDHDHVLLLVIHHIIADGWSMSVLFSELSQAYNALTSGNSPDWSPLPVQYADYSLWQRDWLSGAELERQTKFWQQQLTGAPTRLALPLDHSRPKRQSYRGAWLTLKLSAGLTQAAQRLARSQGCTLFMVLLAAFDAVLARYSGSEDIVIGTPVAGRSRTELEGLIGFFVNTLVLRTDLGGNPTFAELIARVRQTALDAYAHQDLPFEKLVEVLQPERDPACHPIVQAVLTLHNQPVSSFCMRGLDIGSLQLHNESAKFDLNLHVAEVEGALEFGFGYNPDLFDETTIHCLAHDLEHVLVDVVTDPSVRLSDLLSSDAGGVETAASRWTEATVVERFATQVVQTPKAIAVRTPRSARSYGALDEQANGIAHALRARVNKSDGYAPRVGLLCRQDLLLPAGMLGILKAGCVWVPLDPSWPQARLQAIAVDAGLTAIVADYPHQSLAASLNVAVVDLDVPARLDAPDVTPNADDLACIIYTSGSTGKPKGVMQTHRGLLLQAMRYSQSLDIQAGDRLSLLSSYAYDAAIQDVFGALLNGATLCPLSVRDGETLAEQTALVKTLVDLSVTVVHATPSLYRYLFGGELTCADDLSAVRRVVLGGEAVRRSDFELYRSRFTAPCQFINGLGLTESTLGVQFCADHETRLLGQSVPIGTAVSGLSVELRDEAGEPGWLGEIVLHGEGLSPGYWGEALRAEPNVLHTGDLGRRLPDGQIVYMGRRDHQVKLRGYRVEPGEVEARINALEGVTDCAVTVVERSGESWLVAYIESAGIAASDATSAPSLAKWRTQLSGQLPGYMVPQSFEGIESLPRLANGKVDYRQLPAPRFGRVLDESLVPARTELESRLQAIWQDVLQVETLGVHDDFFAMGGHSLLATRLIARVRDQLQLEVPLISLFEHPTIAGMAVGLETSGTHQRVPELKSLSRKGRNT